jgi:hypothetical protein
MKTKVTTELHLTVDSKGDLTVNMKGNSNELEAAFASMMDDDERFFDVMRSAVMKVVVKQLTEHAAEEEDEVAEQMEGILPNNVWGQVVGEA